MELLLRAGARTPTLAAVCAFSLFLAGPSHAQGMPRREPPLILGGARPQVRPVVPLDPRLPTGTRVGSATRPDPENFSVQCSARRPVCVHATLESEAHALGALRALEIAYERLVVALQLPPPPGDFGLGTSDGFDAYLVAPEAELEALADPPLLSSYFAKSSGFCRLPVGDPLLMERGATLCFGEAIALGLDASEPPHLRRAFATWLWWATGLPTSLDAQAIDDAQAHPEQGIATRERSLASEGAALFFEYLETTRSAGDVGQLSAALFSAAASALRPLELDYVDEPDAFDVLRHSLDEAPARFAGLMVDFAIARAFVGDRDDGLHLPSLAWTGAFGRVRFDWMIRFSSLPRRVLVSPPVDSMGAVLIWIDLDEVPLGATLGLEVEWEPPVSFQWCLVRLGSDGTELSRVDVPFQERGNHAEARVALLEGARAVLLVGTNLEGIDLSHPFDPDIAPFEPHAATVYLVRL